MTLQTCIAYFHLPSPRNNRSRSSSFHLLEQRATKAWQGTATSRSICRPLDRSGVPISKLCQHLSLVNNPLALPTVACVRSISGYSLSHRAGYAKRCIRRRYCGSQSLRLLQTAALSCQLSVSLRSHPTGGHVRLRTGFLQRRKLVRPSTFEADLFEENLLVQPEFPASFQEVIVGPPEVSRLGLSQTLGLRTKILVVVQRGRQGLTKSSDLLLGLLYETLE